MQLYGIPDEAFFGKETENKKNKEDEEDEKSKGDRNYSSKISSGVAKRGKKMREGIYRFSSKGDNEDDTETWDDCDLDVGGKEGA